MHSWISLLISTETLKTFSFHTVYFQWYLLYMKRWKTRLHWKIHLYELFFFFIFKLVYYVKKLSYPLHIFSPSNINIYPSACAIVYVYAASTLYTKNKYVCVCASGGGRDEPAEIFEKFNCARNCTKVGDPCCTGCRNSSRTQVFVNKFNKINGIVMKKLKTILWKCVLSAIRCPRDKYYKWPPTTSVTPYVLAFRFRYTKILIQHCLDKDGSFFHSKLQIHAIKILILNIFQWKILVKGIQSFIEVQWKR